MPNNCKTHRKQPYNCPLCDQSVKAMLDKILPRGLRRR